MTIDMFTTTDIPVDESPAMSNGSPDFDVAYPGSTPDAPYGFKDNGEPYRRRPSGAGGTRKANGGKGRGNMPASESQARSAAALLGQLNTIIGFSLASLGLPATGAQLAANNDVFVEQAYSALLTDPGLCRKIMGAGAQSGKAALVMAYGMLAISVVPVATAEVKARRVEAAMNEEAAA